MKDRIIQATMYLIGCYAFAATVLFTYEHTGGGC